MAWAGFGTRFYSRQSMGPTFRGSVGSPLGCTPRAPAWKLVQSVCELGGDRLILGGGGGREARGRAALRSTGAREAPVVGKAQTASRMGLGAGGG